LSAKASVSRRASSATALSKDQVESLRRRVDGLLAVADGLDGADAQSALDSILEPLLALAGYEIARGGTVRDTGTDWSATNRSGFAESELGVVYKHSRTAGQSG